MSQLPNTSTANITALRALRGQWLTLLGLYAGVWFTGLRLMEWAWPQAQAERWAILAGFVLLGELGLLWYALPHNHRADETDLLPTFGPGNWLSLFRGMLLGLLAGFLVLPRPQLGVDGLLAWVPMLLYTIAAVSDLFDGYLARITHHSTALGEFLDMELDGLGTLLASALAVQYGVLPWVFLLLGPARQFFLAGMWVRTRRGLPNHNLPHSDYRRVAAGLQMGFISAMLWPFMHPPATVYAGYMAAAPILASFSRDWLIVSGVLTPDAPGYRAMRARLLGLLTEWTPLLLRGIVLIAALILLRPLLADPATRAAFAWPGGGDALITGGLLAAIGGILALLVGGGVLVRLTALLLAFPVGAHILTSGPNWANQIILAACLYLIISGAGRLALWRRDDHYIMRRLGSAR